MSDKNVQVHEVFINDKAVGVIRVESSGNPVGDGPPRPNINLNINVDGTVLIREDDPEQPPE